MPGDPISDLVYAKEAKLDVHLNVWTWVNHPAGYTGDDLCHPADPEDWAAGRESDHLNLARLMTGRYANLVSVSTQMEVEVEWNICCTTWCILSNCSLV